MSEGTLEARAQGCVRAVIYVVCVCVCVYVGPANKHTQRQGRLILGQLDNNGARTGSSNAFCVPYQGMFCAAGVPH